MSTAKQFPTFRTTALPSFSGSAVQEEFFLDCQTKIFRNLGHYFFPVNTAWYSRRIKPLMSGASSVFVRYSEYWRLLRKEKLTHKVTVLSSQGRNQGFYWLQQHPVVNLTAPFFRNNWPGLLTAIIHVHRKLKMAYQAGGTEFYWTKLSRYFNEPHAIRGPRSGYRNSTLMQCKLLQPHDTELSLKSRSRGIWFHKTRRFTTKIKKPQPYKTYPRETKSRNHTWFSGSRETQKV